MVYSEFRSFYTPSRIFFDLVFNKIVSLNMFVGNEIIITKPAQRLSLATHYSIYYIINTYLLIFVN